MSRKHLLETFVVRTPGSGWWPKAAIILLFFLLVVFWGYRLGYLPGLHADEAWAGLKALSYLESGNIGFLGMNNYSGTLQAITSSLSFAVFGKSVAALRIPGVFFNTAALLLLTLAYQDARKLLVFLIILCQSSLLLISPKIAWEVNSFSLFFIASGFLGLSGLFDNGKPNKKKLYFILLVVSMLGSYNHVIFSCLSLSAFTGLMVWTILKQDGRYAEQLWMAFVNLINIVVVFLLMRLSLLNAPIILLLLVMVCIELKYLRTVPLGWLVHPLLGIFCKIFMVAGSILFLYHHGLAFFEVCANYKLLQQVYAFVPDICSKVVLMIAAGIYLLCLVYHILLDIRQEGVSALAAFTLICYCGLFCIFTTNNSLRYYLCLYGISALYMSHKIYFSKGALVLLAAVTLSLLVTGGLMMRIYQGGYTRSGSEVVVGGKLHENPGHFYPKESLVNFMKKKKVIKIAAADDRFFIEEPIKFYFTASPWIQDPKQEVIVDYGSNGYLYLLKGQP